MISYGLLNKIIFTSVGLDRCRMISYYYFFRSSSYRLVSCSVGFWPNNRYRMHSLLNKRIQPARLVSCQVGLWPDNRISGRDLTGWSDDRIITIYRIYSLQNRRWLSPNFIYKICVKNRTLTWKLFICEIH